MDAMGRSILKGTKLWDWRLDEEANELLHFQGDMVDVYKPSLLRCDRGSNRWIRSGRNQTRVEKGQICSVRNAGPATVSIVFLYALVVWIVGRKL